ncbi:DUF6279 family lipoprotein [Microbulbifer sp. TYP-18]|uniref:DUF6279 family lipoprotein n=1 Tax=Microbulbifer sp. TYP-18 TaxID=3230024 RepID=UPI0034C62CDB
MAYNQLDHWIGWQLDDYVDLSRDQKENLKTTLARFHHWHRQTQLPHYAEYLTQLAIGLEADNTQQISLPAVETKALEFWRQTWDRLCDDLLPLIASLNDDQIEQLDRELGRQREKWLKRWRKPPEEMVLYRDRQVRKQSKRWLGPLNHGQEASIAIWAEVSYEPLHHYRQRQLWQNRFVELLRDKPKGYQQQLRAMMMNPAQLWPQEYRLRQEQRRISTRRLAEAILADTSPRQRRYLADKLRDYAEDFRALSAQ